MLCIRRVDPSRLKTAQILTELQAEILPLDEAEDISKGYWWLAYIDSKPVAFCSLKLSSRWTDTGYLNRAGVLDGYTGRGIQKKLIRVRERYAKKLGWNWLISNTYENPASTNSLIRCGFQMYIPSRKYMGKGTCYWRKKIGEK